MSLLQYGLGGVATMPMRSPRGKRSRPRQRSVRSRERPTHDRGVSRDALAGDQRCARRRTESGNDPGRVGRSDTRCRALGSRRRQCPRCRCRDCSGPRRPSSGPRRRGSSSYLPEGEPNDPLSRRRRMFRPRSAPRAKARGRPGQRLMMPRRPPGLHRSSWRRGLALQANVPSVLHVAYRSKPTTLADLGEGAVRVRVGP